MLEVKSFCLPLYSSGLFVEVDMTPWLKPTLVWSLLFAHSVWLFVHLCGCLICVPLSIVFTLSIICISFTMIIAHTLWQLPCPFEESSVSPFIGIWFPFLFWLSLIHALFAFASMLDYSKGTYLDNFYDLEKATLFVALSLNPHLLHA